MPPNWLTRVDAYLSDLQIIADELEALIRTMKLDTEGLDPAQVERGYRELGESLSGLEAKVAERESLLQAQDAPESGSSLSEKLSASDSVDAPRVAGRCRKVADQIALAHERAVALFVCQLNLAQFSADIVRAMSRQDPESTYQSPQRIEKKADFAGGLLDEAA